ncbi:MAG: 4'-phosphopantetheinyl transferase superfamily protein [Bacteroidales bacterium]|nr:4'-phosphopantetheinyl transferase superfamily protein [Bacteroidales bacterium]
MESAGVVFQETQLDEELLLVSLRITEETEKWLLLQGLYQEGDQVSHPKRRNELMAARAIVNHTCKVANPIVYDAEGKPFLESCQFQISITHTADYVAVLFSKNQPVGLDAEYASDRVMKISGRFLSEEETRNTCHESQSVHQMIYWTMKEAMLKLVGDRKLDFKEELKIQAFGIQKSGETTGVIFRQGKARTCQLKYIVNDALIISWAMFS